MPHADSEHERRRAHKRQYARDVRAGRRPPPPGDWWLRPSQRRPPDELRRAAEARRAAARNGLHGRSAQRRRWTVVNGMLHRLWGNRQFAVWSVGGRWCYVKGVWSLTPGEAAEARRYLAGEPLPVAWRPRGPAWRWRHGQLERRRGQVYDAVVERRGQLWLVRVRRPLWPREVASAREWQAWYREQRERRQVS